MFDTAKSTLFPLAFLVMLGIIVSFPTAALAQAPTTILPNHNPLFRDFMGLNVHSVGFKPAIYTPVCRLLRDYHPIDWDLGDDTSSIPPFPAARNGVDWDHEYGAWKSDGYDIDASLQFESIPISRWKNLPGDCLAYGQEFARAFGPSGSRKYVSCVEIGNEPGKFSPADYRTIFENMARGVRKRDPQLKIATCNVMIDGSDNYSQNISALKGLDSLYDIINVHSYAFSAMWPTWKHSYPEDPTIKFLDPIKKAIDWRNRNAPDKQVWLTEFGWDSSTKTPPAAGDAGKWIGNTDTQQAQYLVRSFLLFSSLGLDRAYIFYYDDNDDPTLFGSSGLTRHFAPKPSFYAVSHLYHTLAGYRFAKCVPNVSPGVDAYEYRSENNKQPYVWVLWSPTGSDRQEIVTLPSKGLRIIHSEFMPLKDGPAQAVPWQSLPDGRSEVTVGETPEYFWMSR